MRVRLLAGLSTLLLLAFLFVPRARVTGPIPSARPAADLSAAWSPADASLSGAAADRDAARKALDRLAQPLAAAGANRLVLRDGPVVASFTAEGLALSAVDRARKMGWTVHWSVVGARPVAPAPEGELDVRLNTLIGKPSEWTVNQPGYAKARYAAIRDGVDLVFESRPHGVEYSFEVAPGADAGGLRMRYDGATAVRVSERGDAVEVTTGLGTFRESGLLAYQDVPGGRREVAARYRSTGDDTYEIELGEYDATLPLVVDPTIAWSTYVGGRFASDPWRASEFAWAAAVDVLGDLVVAGTTDAKDIATPGVFQTTAPDLNANSFIAKIKGDGSGIAWATYLGSAVPTGLAFDSARNVYMTGWTGLANFPIVGGFQSQPHGGENAVVAKLSADGATLLWSSYLGGNSSDHGLAIAVDGSNNVYVAGQTHSFTFPVMNGVDSGWDFDGNAFVTKIAASGSTILWSSRLGGSLFDAARGIALDGALNVYVAGSTQSSDFPTSTGSLSRTLGGSSDAFVFKLNPAGTAMSWSTYLGGTQYEEGRAIAVDTQNNVYVGGFTGSPDFPVKGGFQMSFLGQFDGFVTKLNNTGTRTIWSSFLGGDGGDLIYGLAIDSSRNVYVVGQTNSSSFPVPNGFRTQNFSNPGGFVTKVRAAGNSLAWSSYTGGHTTDIATAVAVDAAGNAFVVGSTNSGSLIATDNGFDQTLGGMGDAYVLKVATGGALLWGSYYGGQYTDGYEELRAAAVDGAGNVYLTGNTNSVDFPATPGAYDLTKEDSSLPTLTHDAFVTKLSSAGALVWSTYLGGELDDVGRAVAVDGLSNVYVSGTTASWQFPVIAGGYRTEFDGHDMFVAKLNPTGSDLLWSTFLGGIAGFDTPNAIALDGALNVVVVGQVSSADFPIAGGGYDSAMSGQNDAFVLRLSASGSALHWSTFLGGGATENAFAVALDGNGRVHVVGETSSGDFPVPGGFDTSYSGGNTEAFVAKLSANGKILTWASFLGGNGSDTALDVAVNGAGDLFVAGETGSFDFPVTAGAFGGTYHGGSTDGFLVRIKGNGTQLTWSSCLGGDGNDTAAALVLDSAGNPVVAGTTTSSNFPLLNAFQSTRSGFSDAFVTKVPQLGNTITFSTLYGGNHEDQGRLLGIDGSGRLYLGGVTQSNDLAPASPFDPALGGIFDGFVIRIDQ